MIKKWGIRREDKSPWESRVPLVPADLKILFDRVPSKELLVQPSSNRAFSDESFKKVGATLEEDLSDCDLVMGVKEIPLSFFRPKKAYIFFSHTLKGQSQNMAMLRKILELGCTLIDYEKIVDEKGRRLVFFGRFAGLAGMLDSFWAIGKRLESEGIQSPFREFKMAHEYGGLNEAIEETVRIGKIISEVGIPKSLQPFVVGFAGYGNVSRGAQEIFDLLPFVEIDPEGLLQGKAREIPGNKIVKVVFHEEHTVKPRSVGAKFNLSEYFEFPDLYESNFRPYINHLSMLMNCIYWSSKAPRLLTQQDALEIWGPEKSPALKVIGDLSCDILGGIECNVKATNPDKPVYVFHPSTKTISIGVNGEGPVIMAVDNLPCELSTESSEDFSKTLMPFMAGLLEMNDEGSFAQANLPEPLKKATLVWKGEFTPDFEYLKDFVK